MLVANRGEIAVRVMRTLRRLGIESVAVYSDADAGAPHVRAADAAVRLGPAPAAQSYLSVEKVIEAAQRTGAEAIHPGYGFLSERPALPEACAAAGIAFVGPGAEAMALLGDKVAAKEVAERAGVPIVPGLHRAALTDDEIGDWAAGQELPLMLKAAAGGGGRGMRVVRALGDLPEAVGAARREAMGAFGDDRLLVERYLERPRHIEVQVIADAHGTVLHLGERECSLQRRHQKVVEEAPSPVVDGELRMRMGEAAVALARSAGYVNAGTVELIAARDDPSSFYFLEMNARLQVEHPVTEAVCGLDVVELQLRVAAGEPLPLGQDDVRLDGHAIEARVYAEDPATGFLPSTGRIAGYREPSGVRVDSGVAAGSVVGSDYDPMLAKVIAHGPDRATALARLDHALGEMLVVGPTTNAAWLRALLRRPEVRTGELDTGLIERLGDEVAPPPPAADLAGVAVAALTGPPPTDDPWDARDGWRPGGARAVAHALLSGPDGPAMAALEPGAADRIARRGDGALLVCGDDGVARTIDVIGDGDAVWLVDAGVPTRWAPATDSAAQHHGSGSLEAPMPGVVLDVRAALGATVTEGDVLVVLESMKMELTVVAPAEGTVAELHVQPGDTVTRGQVMVVVE
ncbi:ATP-binding protein [Capillimicrobium parvum]|uniref:ATP-binding protein n=1 Tax=Capillimicrobium parvum TaxID=2884022 RepID=UPI00216B0D7E|nr:biotin carboxylase N-terminal domain-containing protein [Capillimicrobium parvum]